MQSHTNYSQKIPMNSGIINMIVLIIVALIILGYFKINVADIINSSIVQENLKYAWDLIVWGFNLLKENLLQTLGHYIHIPLT